MTGLTQHPERSTSLISFLISPRGSVFFVTKCKRLHFVTKNTDPLGEIKKEINEVLRSGCWVKPVIVNNQLFLNTKVNLILTHKNLAAGYDITQDFGQFSVR